MGYALSTTNLARRRAALDEPYGFATALLMVTAFLVSIFYSLDALHGERRDRSILFWKSLPVSDLTTVLSKASIPLVVLPLLTFAIIVATVSIMLLLSSLVLLGSGVSVATLWTRVVPDVTDAALPPGHRARALACADLRLAAAGLGLGAARGISMGFLPPLAIGVVEKIAFHTSHFFAHAAIPLRRAAARRPCHHRDSIQIDPMMHITPGRFLSSPGLWIGLLITAGFLAAAVRLRRYQGPI